MVAVCLREVTAGIIISDCQEGRTLLSFWQLQIIKFGSKSRLTTTSFDRIYARLRALQFHLDY